MENSIDIKALWRQQIVPDADRSELLSRINRFRRRRFRKLIILNILLLLTIFFAVFVWMYFKPQLISTKIGIILTILPIGTVVTYSCRLIPLCRKIDDSCSNIDYLSDLSILRNKENFMQTKILNIYFVLLSLGISLYMYEYILDRSLIFGIIAYSAFLLWAGINWLVLRPKIIRKNRQQMNKLIGEVEKIKQQLNNN